MIKVTVKKIKKGTLSKGKEKDAHFSTPGPWNCSRGLSSHALHSFFIFFHFRFWRTPQMPRTSRWSRECKSSRQLAEKVKAYSDDKERKYFWILRWVLIIYDPRKVTDSLCKDFLEILLQGGQNLFITEGKKTRHAYTHTHTQKKTQTPFKSIGTESQFFCM